MKHLINTPVARLFVVLAIAVLAYRLFVYAPTNQTPAQMILEGVQARSVTASIGRACERARQEACYQFDTEVLAIDAFSDEVFMQLIQNIAKDNWRYHDEYRNSLLDDPEQFLDNLRIKYGEDGATYLAASLISGGFLGEDSFLYKDGEVLRVTIARSDDASSFAEDCSVLQAEFAVDADAACRVSQYAIANTDQVLISVSASSSKAETGGID